MNTTTFAGNIQRAPPAGRFSACARDETEAGAEEAVKPAVCFRGVLRSASVAGWVSEAIIAP